VDKDLKQLVKFIEINKEHPGQSLRGLELSGDINSDGGITVLEAIYEVSGYRIEYFLYDTDKAGGKYVSIGLTSGKNDITLVIKENGNLYLSK
jgi:hypothetical protein